MGDKKHRTCNGSYRLKYVILLALSQIADVASTVFGITHGAHELNPFVAVLMTSGGVAAVILFKAMVVVLAAILTTRAVHYGLTYVRFINGVVIGLSVLTFAIAISNMVTWV